MQVQCLGGMGSMGSGNVRPPGKSRLTFNHILSRLQGESQELHNLTGVMNDTDTLSESLVCFVLFICLINGRME